MGKRLSKPDLLNEISVEKKKLDSLLEKLDSQQMVEAGVTPGGWSVKDILCHLIGWQRMNLAWYDAGERGEDPEVPGHGLTWRETPKLNAIIYREHRDRPLSEVPDDFASSHLKMLALVDRVSDDDLVTVGRYRWTGRSWTLSDYIRANTASHYRWASNHIKKWMRQRGLETR